MKADRLGLALVPLALLIAAVACETKPPPDATTPTTKAPASTTNKAATKTATAKADAGAAAGKTLDASTLRGKLTYVRRNAKGVLELYAGPIGGKTTKIYTHENKGKNANILFPRWTKDGSRIVFQSFQGDNNVVLSVKPDGSDLRVEKDRKPDNVSRSSRADDITIEGRTVTVVAADGSKRKLFTLPGQSSKLSSGPKEASWGPERKHVIFQACGVTGCYIRVVDLEGKVATLGKGRAPDWT